MTPFQKNLQRFFIFFFTSVSILVIVIGINRTKKIPQISEVPTPEPATSPVGEIPKTGTVAAFTGKTYQTPYGNVAAAIQVKDGKVIAVTMPKVPNSPPSIYAEPYLVDQALKSGGANIQGVSGATYTSLAFKSSLESAIAQAQTQGQTITAGSATAGTNATAASPKPSVPRQYREDDDEDEEGEDDWFR